jgi:hypothetical protein
MPTPGFSVDPITSDEIVERMGYHPATKFTAKQHDAARNVVLVAALDLADVCPPCRETSLAITHLEEALMWANKAIARTAPLDQLHPEVARVLPD